ncbi:MAG: hypothetical protein GXP55_00435 [Deltaproteobacteria bacterium]|nr:hypothetical protein [Deltaproteobacteria bacterium]
MHWLFHARRGALLVALLALSGCVDNTATATFPIGSEVRLSSTDLGLPADLRDTSSGSATVASIPCLPTNECPSAPVAMACVAGVCDPEPMTVTAQVGGVIDFEELVSGLDMLFADVRSIQLISLEYVINSNTSTVGVEPIEVFWAPAGAVGVDPAMGARLLGNLPAVAAMAAGQGSATIDPSGSRALSAQIVSDPRIKLFVRTGIDLDPGGVFPEGDIDLMVRMTVRVEGTIL